MLMYATVTIYYMVILSTECNEKGSQKKRIKNAFKKSSLAFRSYLISDMIVIIK